MTSHAPILKYTEEMRQWLADRGISEDQFRTLETSIYPGARRESILMAIAYCRAHDLDVLTKPVHIMPMRVKIRDETGRETWQTRDQIVPSITFFRTTAESSGTYLGIQSIEFGPLKSYPQ